MEDTGRNDAPPEAREGVLGRLKRSIPADDVLGLAAEIAYRFLFAVFPFGLFVAALGAFIASALRIENPAQQIVDGMGDNLPQSIAQALQPELERLLDVAQPGLLSVGALTALWAATGGTNALVKGIHRAYDLEEQRPVLLRYAMAIGLTLLAALGIFVSFVTIVGGAILTEQVASRFGLGEEAAGIVSLLRWPAVFIALTLAVAILYRYGPSLVVPWRWILVGAAAFTVGWIVATVGLAFYATNVADYGATYGTLGGVIVLMLWFYLTGVLLLLGAEITAALARERSPEEIRVRGEEEAVAERVQGVTERAKQGVTGSPDRV